MTAADHEATLYGLRCGELGDKVGETHDFVLASDYAALVGLLQQAEQRAEWEHKMRGDALSDAASLRARAERAEQRAEKIDVRYVQARADHLEAEARAEKERDEALAPVRIHAQPSWVEMRDRVRLLEEALREIEGRELAYGHRAIARAALAATAAPPEPQEEKV